VLASVAAGKRPSQVVFAFAVEQGPRRRIVAKALAEMARKNADFVLLNTPAAMGAQRSAACILSRHGLLLPWKSRTKSALARAIVRIVESAVGQRQGPAVRRG
jgi:phosphopantothenoylcysteine synthetase/decarboxylase